MMTTLIELRLNGRYRVYASGAREELFERYADAVRRATFLRLRHGGDIVYSEQPGATPRKLYLTHAGD